MNTKRDIVRSFTQRISVVQTLHVVTIHNMVKLNPSAVDPNILNKPSSIVSYPGVVKFLFDKQAQKIIMGGYYFSRSIIWFVSVSHQVTYMNAHREGELGLWLGNCVSFLLFVTQNVPHSTVSTTHTCFAKRNKDKVNANAYIYIYVDLHNTNLPSNKQYVTYI